MIILQIIRYTYIIMDQNNKHEKSQNSLSGLAGKCKVIYIAKYLVYNIVQIL